MLEYPPVWVSDYVGEFDHPVFRKTYMSVTPIRFGDNSPLIRLPSPEFGEHTIEVLHLGGHNKVEVCKGDLMALCTYSCAINFGRYEVNTNSLRIIGDRSLGGSGNISHKEEVWL